MNRKVLIAGAGLGGLAAGLRLAKRGFGVEIVEKNSRAGGRLNQIVKDGFTFDTGPSFFSMSYEFEELARDCNISLPFRYMELDPLYTVNFRGSNKYWHLYKDAGKLAAQFDGIEPRFREKFERYMKKSGALFHDTVDLVIKNNFDSTLAYIFTLMRVNPVHVPVLFRSFYSHVKRYFNSREAQQIISLVAFFLGRTPFDTMGIYSLLSYTEFRHDGYYNVEGGMYKIVEGLVAELEKAGVTMHYNTEITGFEEIGGKLVCLLDQHGRKWVSDVYLVNADAAWFRGKVFAREKYSDASLAKMNWTMGYLTFYLGLKCKLPEVNHHNYYLGNNFEEYARNVMKKPDAAEKPYYYVNVLSKHNPGCAPQGCESLFFVCPVPNLYYKENWDDRDEIVESIISDFSERTGRDISSQIISKTVLTPVEWRDMFNLNHGSGLGLAHNMKQIGAFRPANFDEKYKNVFYVGASTVPGAGLPMSVISSRLAVQRIEKYAAQGKGVAAGI